MMQILIVAQQQRRPANLREHHIEVTVAINVSKGRTASHDWLEQIGAGFLRRNGNKAPASALTGVPKQLGGLLVLLALLNFADLLLEMSIGGEQNSKEPEEIGRAHV